MCTNVVFSDEILQNAMQHAQNMHSSTGHKLTLASASKTNIQTAADIEDASKNSCYLNDND